MRIKIIQGDITEQRVDAIVNAANGQLRGGGGVDGAIRSKGGEEIAIACEEIHRKRGWLDDGDAVVTGAGRLAAQFVIHAIGPVWKGGGKGEAEALRGAYQNSLMCAEEVGAKSVAFPSISTGIFGYPVEQAASVALEAVVEHLQAHPAIEEVRFLLFSKEDFGVYQTAYSRHVQGSID